MTTKDFQTKGTLSIFFHYFKAHRKLFALDMTCALFMSLVDLAFPYVSRTCMYDLLPDNLYGTFFTVMGVMLAAYVIRAGLQYIVCYWGHTFGILVEADIRRDLFALLTRKGWPLLAMRNTDLTLEDIFLQLTSGDHSQISARKQKGDDEE